MDTMIIKFTRDYEVQDEKAGTEDATFFKKGLRKKFPLKSAEHFISRGAAVPAVPAEKKAAKSAKK